MHGRKRYYPRAYTVPFWKGKGPVLRLFLSYAREDVDRVRRFAAELRRTGIEPWMDDELKLAGRWNTEIEDRIAACDLFLAIQSRATQEGNATRFFCKEWRLAHKASRCFLPVRLEECRLPASLPKTLATAIESYKHEDLFPTYEVGLRRILRCLYDKKRTGVFEETFSCLCPDNAGWRLGAGQSHMEFTVVEGWLHLLGEWRC